MAASRRFVITIPFKEKEISSYRRVETIRWLDSLTQSLVLVEMCGYTVLMNQRKCMQSLSRSHGGGESRGRDLKEEDQSAS